MSSDTLNSRLLEICANGELDEAKTLVTAGADPFWQDATGQNSLIVSSKYGHLSLVTWLLELGVPWNALDKQGYCAGDYAVHGEYVELANCLLDAGCRAEMIFGAIQRRNGITEDVDDFLKDSIYFTDDGKCILDSNGQAVMMEWEKPLMEAHAEALCVKQGDVLNVGFGLGLIDEAIQKRGPKSHTIIEAHPQIYAFMLERGWDQRPGVRIIHSKWQEVQLEDLGKFDSVFFDTYGEHYSDLYDFHQLLPKLMKPDGVYSFFNGLAPDNGFFHLVYCEIVKAELKSLGFDTQFVPLPVNTDSNETWKGVKHRYWWNDVYQLPVAQFMQK
eukprot:g3532.t1